MPSIVAPAPRLAPQHSHILAQDRYVCCSHLIPPRFSPHPQHRDSRAFLPPPRLLSPLRLHDPPFFAHVCPSLSIAPSLTCLQSSKSPPLCGPTHKRRPSSRLLARSVRRRRHVQRVESPFDAFGRSSIFDQLPWISALEMPTPVNCDIADLSQLPLDEDPLKFSETMPAFGPVRRRKTSLRSNPIGSSHEPPPSELPVRQPSPIHRPTDPLPGCPRTPPPHLPFDPSRVTFHKLMPVFPRGVHPGTPF